MQGSNMPAAEVEQTLPVCSDSSLTSGFLKESEAARLFRHCLLQPPLITQLPSAAVLLQLADAVATAGISSSDSQLVSAQSCAALPA